MRFAAGENQKRSVAQVTVRSRVSAGLERKLFIRERRRVEGAARPISVR